MHPALRPMAPPLDPTADEARAWAEEELAKAVYSSGPGLIERFLRWLADLWDQLFVMDGAGQVLLPFLVLAIIGAIIAAAVALGGPVRRRRLSAQRASMQILDDDARSAESLREAADAAAASGDYTRAVLDRFRALVRSLDERGILADRRGRTALEAARGAGAAFADQARELRRAGELFDSVCYGSQTPTADQDAWLRHLEARIARSRPASRMALAPEDPGEQ